MTDKQAADLEQDLPSAAPASPAKTIEAVAHANAYDAEQAYPFGPKTERRMLAAQALMVAVDAYCYPAVRRALAMARPLVPSRQSLATSVASTHPDVKRFPAVVILYGFPIKSLYALSSFQMPAFMTTPDAMYFQARHHPGKIVMNSFGTLDPQTGQSVNDISVGTIVPPQKGPSDPIRAVPQSSSTP